MIMLRQREHATKTFTIANYARRSTSSCGSICGRDRQSHETIVISIVVSLDAGIRETRAVPSA
jgi:hypothetical protein